MSHTKFDRQGHRVGNSIVSWSHVWIKLSRKCWVSQQGRICMVIEGMVPFIKGRTSCWLEGRVREVA